MPNETKFTNLYKKCIHSIQTSTEQLDSVLLEIQKNMSLVADEFFIGKLSAKLEDIGESDEPILYKDLTIYDKGLSSY